MSSIRHVILRREPEHDIRIFMFKVMQLGWLLLGILETMIALRIILKLIGANPENAIVALIYGFTGLFLAPFMGLASAIVINGRLLEISPMFAMLVYGLLGWAIERLVWLIFSRPHDRIVSVKTTNKRADPD